MDDDGLEVAKPKDWAAGVPGVTAALRQSYEQMGVRRTALTLLRVNQKKGFDCPGCAWPEGDKRHVAEFCENGAKAVAEEATIKAGRRVVFVNPDDLASLALADGVTVDLVSEWSDGTERRAPGFRLVAYPTARGCAAAYFPETNVLVPLDSTADISNTPTSKSIVIRLERA